MARQKGFLVTTTRVSAEKLVVNCPAREQVNEPFAEVGAAQQNNKRQEAMNSTDLGRASTKHRMISIF